MAKSSSNVILPKLDGIIWISETAGPPVTTIITESSISHTNDNTVLKTYSTSLDFCTLVLEFYTKERSF